MRVVIVVASFSTALVLACAHRVVDYALIVGGVVVDDRGEPLADAHIVVEIPRDEPVGSVRYGEAWTDARGGFGLDLPTLGPVRRYSLSVEKQGYLPTTLEDTQAGAEIQVLILGSGRCQQHETPGSIPEASTALDSVKILSISPEAGTTLHVGDKISLKLDVEYKLASAPSGVVTLVIQQAESGQGERTPLDDETQVTQVIQKGNGKLTLTKDIDIPDTSALEVFTPLTAQGARITRTVDAMAYKVAKK